MPGKVCNTSVLAVLMFTLRTDAITRGAGETVVADVHADITTTPAKKSDANIVKLFEKPFTISALFPCAKC